MVDLLKYKIILPLFTTFYHFVNKLFFFPLLSWFTAGVRQIDIDISGRILIPKDLINHAKIKKEVVVSSAVNILEIWDKTYYENAIDDAKFDFGSLAEEVMGDKDE